MNDLMTESEAAEARTAMAAVSSPADMLAISTTTSVHPRVRTCCFDALERHKRLIEALGGEAQLTPQRQELADDFARLTWQMLCENEAYAANGSVEASKRVESLSRQRIAVLKVLGLDPPEILIPRSEGYDGLNAHLRDRYGDASVVEVVDRPAWSELQPAPEDGAGAAIASAGASAAGSMVESPEASADELSGGVVVDLSGVDRDLPLSGGEGDE